MKLISQVFFLNWNSNLEKSSCNCQLINFSSFFQFILGFTLWTSSHGFHHLALSNRKGWKCVWAFILMILVLSLACCIIYYFYYVFSTAVYSRFTIESPAKRIWPTTIICEKQVFTLNKINSVNSFTTAHASLLSWSLGNSNF